MIYTVTFNPSIDYIVRLEQFTPGEINRVNYEQILPGGKGINVSIVLKNLGHDSTALGFLAGFTGTAMQQQLRSFGVTEDFVRLDEGFSRINVKIKAERETEINGQGPKIPPEAQRALFENLDRLKRGDTLVLAGSIPNTLPDDIYERIMEHLNGRGIRIADHLPTDGKRGKHLGMAARALRLLFHLLTCPRLDHIRVLSRNQGRQDLLCPLVRKAEGTIGVRRPNDIPFGRLIHKKRGKEALRMQPQNLILYSDEQDTPPFPVLSRMIYYSI